jgi:GT2 family glycosyltransferase
MNVQSKIKLSIVIVTYNSQEYIYNCLESINKFNDIGNDLEVIIIDNKSNEDAELMSSKITYDFNTRIIYSGNNLGFGVGNNLGVDFAKGEIVCFLNADTILIEKIFKKAIKFFLKPNIRTLGVKLLNEKKESELSFFFVRGYFSSFSSFFVFKLNFFNFKLKNMITSGACMFVRKKDFKLIGGFNPNMFLYHEESYLARKFLNHFDDNIFYFDKTLKLIHLEKSGPASKMLSTEYYKSMVFYYKYFNFNMKYLAKIFYFKQLLKDLFYKRNNAIIENESKLINFFINK